MFSVQRSFHCGTHFGHPPATRPYSPRVTSPRDPSPNLEGLLFSRFSSTTFPIVEKVSVVNPNQK